jgi:hypothetical protein
MECPKIDSRIQLIQGDITKLNVDAIVNAANRSLLGGGGSYSPCRRASDIRRMPSYSQSPMDLIPNQLVRNKIIDSYSD